MELFVPSLVMLLLAGFIVLFIIPRISPFIIFVLCTIFFILAIYGHSLLFYNEYKYSLWKDSLQNSVPTILTIVIAIGLIISILNLFTNIKINIPIPSLSIESIQPIQGVQPIQPIQGTNQKKFSTVDGYKNIPIEKIKELEKQL